MEILKDIFSFLTDTSRQFSTRATIFIISLASLLLVNNILGFTYYHNLSNKIEKIAAINQIIKDTAISTNDRNELIRLRGEILNKKDLVESFSQNTKEFYNKLRQGDSSKNQVAKSEGGKIPQKNYFLFLLSSSGLYIGLIIFILPFGLITWSKQKNPLNFFTGVIFVTWCLSLLAVFNYYLFGLIPLIGNSWAWNYLANTVLQLVVFALYSFIIFKLVKKTQSN